METFLKVTFLEVGLIPVTFNVSLTCVSFLCSFVEILLVYLVNKQSCFHCDYDVALVSSLRLKHDKDLLVCWHSCCQCFG